MINFTKLARQAVRQRRQACVHRWTMCADDVEVCKDCKDEFPCAGFKCHHLDCIERGVQLGEREFPTDYPISIVVRNAENEILLDTNGDDPIDWLIGPAYGGVG